MYKPTISLQDDFLTLNPNATFRLSGMGTYRPRFMIIPKISARDDRFSRKTPRMELVVHDAPALRIPRIVMQEWVDSIMTATPRAPSDSSTMSAMVSVIRS